MTRLFTWLLPSSSSSSPHIENAHESEIFLKAWKSFFHAECLKSFYIHVNMLLLCGCWIVYLHSIFSDNLWKKCTTRVLVLASRISLTKHSSRDHCIALSEVIAFFLLICSHVHYWFNIWMNAHNSNNKRKNYKRLREKFWA